MAKLTEKQKRFADYFIESGNAEESAKRAGYNARGNTTKLLHNTTIQQYIADRIASKDSERVADQDEVLEFLTGVLRGKVQETIPLGLGMGEQQLVKKELDGKDRIKAAELLGKRYMLWSDKVELSGDMSIKVMLPTNIGDDDADG